MQVSGGITATVNLAANVTEIWFVSGNITASVQLAINNPDTIYLTGYFLANQTIAVSALFNSTFNTTFIT
jgi:hypothetical protein